MDDHAAAASISFRCQAKRKLVLSRAATASLGLNLHPERVYRCGGAPPDFPSQPEKCNKERSGLNLAAICCSNKQPAGGAAVLHAKSLSELERAEHIPSALPSHRFHFCRIQPLLPFQFQPRITNVPHRAASSCGERSDAFRSDHWRRFGNASSSIGAKGRNGAKRYKHAREKNKLGKQVMR